MRKYRPGSKTIVMACGVLAGLALLGHQLMVVGPKQGFGRGPAGLSLAGRSCDEVFREICRPASLSDPTGIVAGVPIGEQAIANLRDRITDEEDVTDPTEVRRRLIEEVYSPARLRKVEAAFRWVKNAILDEIRNWAKAGKLNPRERRQVTRRIETVVLEFPDPKYPIYGSDDVDIALQDELYFERESTGQIAKVRVGGAYLMRVNSWFNLVFTLAHELSHAIDPCELASEGLRLPVLDRASACFAESGWIALRSTRKSCDQDDQSAEVFADWMATRVTAEALQVFAQEFHGSQVAAAVANSVRDLCDDDTPGPHAREVHRHPPAETRINRIFVAHPVVRDLLGCVPATQRPYCE